MRHLHNPTFSPDGFAGSLPARQRDVVADALSTIAAIAEASRRAMPAIESGNEDYYDDGLVHSHGWASSNAA